MNNKLNLFDGEITASQIREKPDKIIAIISTEISDLTEEEKSIIRELTQKVYSDRGGEELTMIPCKTQMPPNIKRCPRYKTCVLLFWSA